MLECTITISVQCRVCYVKTKSKQQINLPDLLTPEIVRHLDSLTVEKVRRVPVNGLVMLMQAQGDIERLFCPSTGHC